jgi:hypothetical protein
MAKYSNGINGPFNGKLGTAVGCVWKGIPYLRSLPSPRTGQPGEREMLNRKKWAMSQEWLRPITYFVREGFRGYSPTVEGFIAAKSYLLKNAFEGVAPDIVINPALVKVSSGSLFIPEQLAATRVSDKEVQFTWDPSTIPHGNRRDQIMMLGYNIETRLAPMILSGQFAKAGADVLHVPSPEKGPLHIYAAFISGDRSIRSDSVYLGAL